VDRPVAETESGPANTVWVLPDRLFLSHTGSTIIVGITLHNYVQSI
jgi:hypothetical protein